MKKNGGSVVATVKKLAEPIAESLGYELWDVEYVKEGADYYLRITIDSSEGITIDDCEKM
ncbi:MAG: ribosome maturation factor RimP, partial [Clostridia bacterium]|nr:ribosome maturation factor RimP [Clostridia bacterium]